MGIVRDIFGRVLSKMFMEPSQVIIKINQTKSKKKEEANKQIKTQTDRQSRTTTINDIPAHQVLLLRTEPLST